MERKGEGWGGGVGGEGGMGRDREKPISLFGNPNLRHSRCHGTVGGGEASRERGMRVEETLDNRIKREGERRHTSEPLLS